jgi:hypothetical protein
MELILLYTFTHWFSFFYPTTFANRLPQPIPLPIIRSRGFHRASWYYSVVRLLTEHRSPLRFRL